MPYAVGDFVSSLVCDVSRFGKAGRCRWTAPGAQLLLSAMIGHQVIATDDAWRTSPYRVQIWYRDSSSKDAFVVPTAMESGLAPRLEQRLGSSSEVSILPIPEWLTPSVGDTLRSSPTEFSEEFGMRLAGLRCDKVVNLETSREFEGLRVSAWEYDIASLNSGPLIQRIARQPSRWIRTVQDAVAEAVTPVAKVVRIDGDHARLSLRAGLLQVPSSSRTVTEGSCFVVRVRKSGSRGGTKEGRSRDVPWTILEVVRLDRGFADCKVHTGLQAPWGFGGLDVVERLALLAEPKASSTRMHLTYGDASPPVPRGMEILARDPSEREPKVLGRTDHNGMLRLMRSPQSPLQICYVRYGGRILARVPILVGHLREIEVTIPDDGLRVDAEGFLWGIEDRVVDAVARRTLLAARIRRAIQKKNWKLAESCLEEIKDLESRDQLVRELRQGQREFRSADSAVQARIDRLFADTLAVVNRQPENPSSLELQAELRDARRRGESQY